MPEDNIVQNGRGVVGPFTLIVITVLVIIAIFFIGYQSHIAAEKATLDEFNSRQLVMAKGATSGIELYFDSIAGNIATMGQMEEVQMFDESTARREVEHSFNKLEPIGVNDVGILDADGILRYNIAAPQIEGMDFSWREYFVELKDPAFQGDYIIEFIEFKGADLGQKGVLIAVPMYIKAEDAAGPGEFGGVVLCTVKLESVTQRFITPIQSSEAGHALLIDDEYTVLWSPDGSLVGRNIMDESQGFPDYQGIIEKMARGEIGTSEYSYYQYSFLEEKYTTLTQEKLIAYAPVNIGNDLWSIGVWAPKDDARKLIRSAYIKQLVLVGLSTLIIIIGASYALIMSQRMNKRLQDDIKYRKKTEETLKDYSEKLEESNRLKDLFLDIMHHDLSTPLTVIRSAVEFIDDDTMDARESADFIEKNVLRAQDLIDSALMFSELEDMKTIQPEEMDLLEIMEKIVGDLGPLAEGSGQTIENNITQKMSFRGNKIIEQVFSNLISNAIKYSPMNKRIVIDGEDSGTSWKIGIMDFGEGISDADKTAIFERFMRTNKESVRGSGLGLAIAKRIVELHNGKIWVEDNPGGGSIFFVSLPKK